MQLVDNVSAMQQCLAFLESLGIKDDMAEAKALESAVKSSPGRQPISARHIVDLLESAAQLTERSDVGVSFAAWLSPHNLAPR